MSALPVSQNVPAFQWTKPRLEAAALVAENALSEERIAEAVGVDRRTLFRWRQVPEFQARVAEHIAELEAATLRYGIAKRRRRVAALDDRWNRLQRVIEERAADPKMADVPGGTTGLVVRQVKLVKVYTSSEDEPPGDDEASSETEVLYSAKRDVQVEEYTVDAPLLKEIRATEEQASKELGQWVEKQEHSGEMLLRQYVGVPVEDV